MLVTRYRRFAKRPVGVNLRRERFVPTGPLTPKQPPRQTLPQAAAVRQERTPTRFQAAGWAGLSEGFGHSGRLWSTSTRNREARV